VKGTDPERLEHGLRAAAAGDVVLDRDMAQAVTELAMTRRRTSSRPFAELTERQFHILDLVAQGLDDQAIALRLVLSPKAVRNHVSNVLTELHVADRSQALVLGRQRGLGQGST
jgi:DNA-binding NarL/FixJ family response regulator